MKRTKQEQVEYEAQEAGMSVRKDSDHLVVEQKGRTSWHFKRDDQGCEEALEAIRQSEVIRRRPGR